MFCVQVSGAYSKTWSYREDALLAVYQKLMEMSVSTPKEDLKNMMRAAIFLVRRAIKDIVSSVSSDMFDKKRSLACNLLHVLHQLCPSEISKDPLSVLSGLLSSKSQTSRIILNTKMLSYYGMYSFSSTAIMEKKSVNAYTFYTWNVGKCTHRRGEQLCMLCIPPFKLWLLQTRSWTLHSIEKNELTSVVCNNFHRICVKYYS